MDEQLVTLEEAAHFLKVPPKTLYAWRYKGTGPRGFKVGRYVRYRRDEIERWLEDHADQKPS